MKHIYSPDHNCSPSEADSTYGQEINNGRLEAEIHMLDSETELYDWQLEKPDTDERSVFCFDEWLLSYDKEEQGEENGYNNSRRYRKKILKILGATAFLATVVYLTSNSDAEVEGFEEPQNFQELYYEDGTFSREKYESERIHTITEQEGIDPKYVQLISREEAERLIAETEDND